LSLYRDFFHGKRVPRMAGIAARRAKTRSIFLQIGDLGGRFQTDFVAGAAAFHPLRHGHGLIVKRRHAFHGGPSECVFAVPTRAAWHGSHVSGVGILAFAASSAVV